MDLNYLYSQHQLSLMHAANATSQLARTRHLAAAGLFAYRIEKSRRAHGHTPAPATQVCLASLMPPGKLSGVSEIQKKPSDHHEVA